MVLLAIQRRQPSVRALLFGLGYFALALAPVLGFVNVYYFRYSFVADHFDYLPSIGLIALATVGLASYFRSSLVKSAMATSAIACFALLTWQRAQVFCDNETLWRDTLQQNPTSTLALNNLGNILQNQDKLTDAESHLRQAIQLQPDYPQVHNNLGVVLAKQGRRDEAIQHFAAALRLQPKYPEAEDNIARLLAEENRLDEAIPPLQRFVELRPDLAEGYLKLGELLRRRHRDAQAIAVYRRGVQVLPDHLHLANELAWTLVTSPDPQLRDPSSAIPLAEHIVTRTKHRAAEPLDTLAAACAAAGRFDEAAAIAEEARAICLRQNQPAAAAAIATRIQMYKDHHPWQQNFPL
jgi:tetratricopeptide (TPR) repeat protein